MSRKAERVAGLVDFAIGREGAVPGRDPANLRVVAVGGRRMVSAHEDIRLWPLQGHLLGGWTSWSLFGLDRRMLWGELKRFSRDQPRNLPGVSTSLFWD